MRKLIIISAVTAILLAGGQQAWAGNRAHGDNKDYRTFKKVVSILDVLVNDGHHRGKNRFYVRTYYHPKKVCYRRGRHKVCTLKHRGYRRYGHGRNYKKYSKRAYHGYDDYRGRRDYR